MKRLWAVVGSVLLVGVLGASSVMVGSHGSPSPLLASVTGRARDDVRAPNGQRIRVQVLNTTKTRGLARRATRLLRDRGFDVVELGTVGPTMDTTLVLDLSGHPAWAEAVAKVMAPAHTRARRDSSRYLDVTVLVGSSWRPPAEPLDP
jgi:LytR cell envelope-related transcriptional attenuator